MSELLKNNSENFTNNNETSGLEALTEMQDKFDPNAAKKLAGQDKPESTESLEKLSPREAANEYLQLLDELSKDFTYPYYSDERQGQHHCAPNITTELGRKYSDNPHYRWRGYASTEAGATDGTMLRIASADFILANEINWRNEGSNTAPYNKNIEQELAISYNDKGNYNTGDGDYGRAKNEARNRQFFGFDDPERAKKVERAIELRRNFEDIWEKDKSKKTGEMPTVIKNDLQVDNWLAEHQASGEIVHYDDLTPEQKIEANKAHFADIQKRRAFMVQLYPALGKVGASEAELDSVPDSIKTEYAEGGILCREMLPGHENGQGNIRYPNGIIMRDYYKKVNTASFLVYQEARKINDQIIDQEALEKFEAPKPDIDTAKEQLGKIVSAIRTITNLEELKKVRATLTSYGAKLPSIGITTDINEAYEWDKTDSTNTIYDELTKQEFQIWSERDRLELEQTEAKAKQAESARQELLTEYQNANILKRATMMIGGYQRKLQALEANATTQNIILKRMREKYQNGSGRWDPTTRSFRKLA